MYANMYGHTNNIPATALFDLVSQTDIDIDIHDRRETIYTH